MLMCVIVLGAVLTQAQTVQFPAPIAQPALPKGDGWYFSEYEIPLGSNANLLIGQVATVAVICPRGYVSTGCIGGTVPPSIANIQFDGGAEQGFGAFSSPPRGVNSGFNVFAGCGITARFTYPIPNPSLTSSVFVKVEAYCKSPSQPTITQPTITQPTTDPCSCLGRCESFSSCGTGTICYVGQAGCPGFAASQRRVGQFYKCVQPSREC